MNTGLPDARRRRRSDALLERPGVHGAGGAPGPGGPLDSQRGAALLALVLALALGSGLVTVEWLEAAAPLRPRDAPHRGHACGGP